MLGMRLDRRVDLALNKMGELKAPEPPIGEQRGQPLAQPAKADQAGVVADLGAAAIVLGDPLRIEQERSVLAKQVGEDVGVVLIELWLRRGNR
jgi:hypothetical protein